MRLYYLPSPGPRVAAGIQPSRVRLNPRRSSEAVSRLFYWIKLSFGYDGGKGLAKCNLSVFCFLNNLEVPGELPLKTSSKYFSLLTVPASSIAQSVRQRWFSGLFLAADKMTFRSTFPLTCRLAWCHLWGDNHPLCLLPFVRGRHDPITMRPCPYSASADWMSGLTQVN